jgi:hypothetical protein
VNRRFPLFLLLFVHGAWAARFALLIGNAHGGSEVAVLKFVDNDLKAIGTTLSGYCGFEKKHIITVAGKGPDEVTRALDRLAAMLPSGEDNLLLLYYTGHADREHLKMGGARLPLAEMKKKFSEFPASIRIGIFDACQSGSFTRLKGGELAEPFLFKDAEKIKGEVILSSSSPTENAQESDMLGNSIFTFHFVNALRGSGDISGDGKVTLSEAYQYSYNHTVSSTARTWGGVQHPSYRFRIQGEGDVVLADLTTGAGGVLLEGSVAGSVTMSDSLNNIVADLNKEKGSRMIIALNPGTYQIMVGNGQGEKWRSKVTVSGKKMVPVAMRQFEKFDPVHIQHKGGTERFRIGVSLGGWYGRYNLQPAARGLRSAFSGFREFGITPRFIENGDGFFGGVGLRCKVRRQFIATFGYSWMIREQEKAYHGSYRIDGYGREYGAELALREQLRLGVFEWGAGYCFTQRYVRGVVVLVGLNCFTVDHSVTSTFTDELYDAAAGHRYGDVGFLFLPWGGGGYSYTFAGNFEVALLARYRYQKVAMPLTSGSVYADHTRFNYDFSGVDVSLHLSAYLVKRSDGK